MSYDPGESGIVLNSLNSLNSLFPYLLELPELLVYL